MTGGVWLRRVSSAVAFQRSVEAKMRRWAKRVGRVSHVKVLEESARKESTSGLETVVSGA